MQPWEAGLLWALAVLAVLIGTHALTRLSSRIRLWRHEGLERPWGRAIGEGLFFGVVWAMGTAFAVVVSFPSHESDTMGAAGALLTLVGGLGIGSYAFVLACVTFAGFFRLKPDGADAPWPRHALLTGLVVTAAWLVLCPSPLLLMGEAQPSAPHLAVLLVGVMLYSVAVVTGVFWRARQPLPEGGPAARESGTPRAGLVGLALVCLLWPQLVPDTVVGLYERLGHGDTATSVSTFEWPGLLLWLVPVTTIIGLHRRREWGRVLALVVCGVAVLAFGATAVWLLMEGDLVWVIVLIPLALFGWPLWYLTRSGIRNLFTHKGSDTNRT